MRTFWTPGEYVLSSDNGGESWNVPGSSEEKVDALNAAMMLSNSKLTAIRGAKQVKMIVETDAVVFEPINANGQVMKQRMFSVQDRKGDANKIKALGQLMNELEDKDTVLHEKFFDNAALDDVQNLYGQGYPEKYRALEDAGLVGEVKGEKQVLGGFFVVDEVEMAKKGGAAAYARGAAGTTIRLLLAMLSCTVGHAAVKEKASDNTKKQLDAIVEDIKNRVAGVKDISAIRELIGTMIDAIRGAVDKVDFTNEHMFDHVKTKTIDDGKGKTVADDSNRTSSFVSDQIEALGIGDGNAVFFIRAFNAITSFVMTANGLDGVDMLTTAAQIMWQFEKVRRMVQIEALKKLRENGDGKPLIAEGESTSHLEDNALPIASGSAYVRGGGGGGGLSRSFVQKMFELYVK